MRRFEEEAEIERERERRAGVLARIRNGIASSIRGVVRLLAIALVVGCIVLAFYVRFELGYLRGGVFAGSEYLQIVTAAVLALVWLLER